MELCFQVQQHWFGGTVKASQDRVDCEPAVVPFIRYIYGDVYPVSLIAQGPYRDYDASSFGIDCIL